MLATVGYHIVGVAMVDIMTLHINAVRIASSSVPIQALRVRQVFVKAEEQWG